MAAVVQTHEFDLSIDLQNAGLDLLMAAADITHTDKILNRSGVTEDGAWQHLDVLIAQAVPKLHGIDILRELYPEKYASIVFAIWQRQVSG